MIKKLCCHFSKELLDCDLHFVTSRIRCTKKEIPLTSKFNVKINFGAGYYHQIEGVEFIYKTSFINKHDLTFQFLLKPLYLLKREQDRSTKMRRPSVGLKRFKKKGKKKSRSRRKTAQFRRGKKGRLVKKREKKQNSMMCLDDGSKERGIFHGGEEKLTHDTRHTHANLG